MLNNYHNYKYRVQLTNGLKIIFLLLIIIFVCIAILSIGISSTVNAYDIHEEVEIKAFVQDNFRYSTWYPLVESIDNTPTGIIIKTYIFPDHEGKRLADEIVKDLRKTGVNAKVTIYGKNISDSFLITSAQ